MAESVVLTVTGMKCGGCEGNVSNQLQTMAGIISVAASSQNDEVKVEFDAEQTNLDAIIAKITEAGFVVEE
ncbi:MAG: heavy-metal-associated domain-containing protein [Methylococcales bacterium]